MRASLTALQWVRVAQVVAGHAGPAHPARLAVLRAHVHVRSRNVASGRGSRHVLITGINPSVGFPRTWPYRRFKQELQAGCTRREQFAACCSSPRPRGCLAAPAALSAQLATTNEARRPKVTRIEAVVAALRPLDAALRLLHCQRLPRLVSLPRLWLTPGEAGGGASSWVHHGLPISH